MNAHFFKRSLAISTLSLGLMAAANAFAETQTYTIDSSHTAVVWDIDHFGFSKPSGKFMDITGSIELDQQNPSLSKVEVIIPVDKVNTGVEKLDEHLKGADFFDVAQFPNATFVSTKVEKISEKALKVTGDLTLHGVTKEVVLDVNINKIGENIFKKQTAGFSATATIKRSDFGITTYLPGLGDEVSLQIQSEANL